MTARQRRVGWWQLQRRHSNRPLSCHRPSYRRNQGDPLMHSDCSVASPPCVCAFRRVRCVSHVRRGAVDVEGARQCAARAVVVGCWGVGPASSKRAPAAGRQHADNRAVRVRAPASASAVPKRQSSARPVRRCVRGRILITRLKDFLPSRSDLVPGKDWEIGEN